MSAFFAIGEICAKNMYNISPSEDCQILKDPWAPGKS